MALPDYVLKKLQEEENTGSGLPDYVVAAMNQAQSPAQDIPAYEPGPPLLTATEMKRKKEMYGPFEGVVEPVLNMAGGFIGSALGGYAGIGNLFYDGVTGKIAEKGLNASMQNAGERVKAYQDSWTYQPKSELGKTVSGAIALPFQKAAEGYGWLGETAGNALGDADTGAAGRAIGEGGFEAAATVLGGIKGKQRYGEKPPTQAGLMNELGQVVNKGFATGIKPSTKGQHRVGDVLRQSNLDAAVVEKLVREKDNLIYKDTQGNPYDQSRLPKTVEELGDAHAQTKLKLLQESERANVAAGQAGAKIPLDDSIAALKAFANDVANIDNFPEGVAEALKKIEVLEKRGFYTPEEAQNSMVLFNGKGKILKENPSTLANAEAVVAGIIAETLRPNLNKFVEMADGPGYAANRKLLGAFISSDEAVAKAVMRARKQDVTSPLGFMDVFSFSNVAKGIASGDWTSVAKGLGLEYVAAKMRREKNADYVVGKMFRKAEPIVEKLKAFDPQKIEKIVIDLEQKMLPMPERGFTMRDPYEQLPGPVNSSPYSPEFAADAGRLNQLALPEPQPGFGPRNPYEPAAGPAMESASVFQRLFNIAGTPEGKRALIEKLGKEQQYSELLKELMAVPDATRALPPGEPMNLLEYRPNTDMPQTQVWRIGENGPYMDQTQQWQILPSGKVIPSAPPSGITKSKVYRVNQNPIKETIPSKIFVEELNRQSSRSDSPLNGYLFSQDTPENTASVLAGRSGHPKNMVYWQEGTLHHGNFDKQIIVLDKTKIPEGKIEYRGNGEHLINAADIQDAIIGVYKNKYDLFERGYSDLILKQKQNALGQ